MAKKLTEPQVETPTSEEEEEEYYAQYLFENCTFNITMAENSNLNIGVGKPSPFPPPQ